MMKRYNETTTYLSPSVEVSATDVEAVDMRRDHRAEEEEAVQDRVHAAACQHHDGERGEEYVDAG